MDCSHPQTVRQVLLALVLPLFLIAGCSNPRPEGGGSRPATATGSGSGLPTTASQETVDRAAPPRQVVLTRANTSQPLILVNASHPWRFDKQRQIALSLGQRHLAYKVISDQRMAELMEALQDKDWGHWSSRFVPEQDTRWFEPIRANDPEFRGMLYVDDGGQRTKFVRRKLSSRDSGDTVFKWQDFHSLFQMMYASAGRTETPGYNVSTSDIQSPR